MDRTIENEIISIKTELNDLNHRVSKLERKAKSEAHENAPAPAKRNIEEEIKTSNKGDVVFDNTVVLKQKSSLNLDKFKNENPIEAIAEPSKALQKPEVEDKNDQTQVIELKETIGQSLEEKIGSYWLNRIGIFSLVIGLALLLMYSFQFYGPVFKVITGICLSIVLIFGGEWMNKHGEPKWYVRGLIGGGWSLAFFTSFAVYHVPAVKLTDNLFIDCLLMSIVCILAMGHALLRKSEVIAGLATVLSLIVIALCDQNQFSLIAQGLLAISLAYMSAKLDWYKLFFWGVIGSYGTFYCAVAPKIEALQLGDWGNLLMAGSYLSIIWLAFNSTNLFLNTYSRNRKVYLTIASIVNAIAFIPAMGYLLKPIIGTYDYLYLVVVALVYGALYSVAREKKLTVVQDVNILVALTSATGAIATFFASSTTNIFWIMEVPVLVWLGMKYKIVSMRGFALLLSMVTAIYTMMQTDSRTFNFLGLNMPVVTIHIVTYALAMAITAAVQRVPSSLNDQGAIVSKTFYYYLIASTSFLWLTPVVALWNISNGTLGHTALSLKTSGSILFWMIECLAIFAIGLISRDSFVKFLACFGSALATLAAITLAKDVLAPVLVLLTAYLFGSMLLSKKIHEMESSATNKNQYYFYVSCFALFLWSLAIAKFSADFLALRWAIEATLLVGIGFWFKDQHIRNIGAVIFGTAVMNLVAFGSAWNLYESLALIVLLYGTSGLHRLLEKNEPENNRLMVAHCYEVTATILLTMFIKKFVPFQWLTFAFSAEGMGLLLTGFLIKDKVFRISGLAVFGLVALKLLFVDLAGAETIARIVSFIIAGLILLIASYAYSKYATRYVKESN